MYNTTGVARGTLMYSIPPAAEETCWQSDQMNYWVSLSAPDHALIIARTERRNVINGERERERAGNKRREGVVGEAETTKGGKRNGGRRKKKKKTSPICHPMELWLLFTQGQALLYVWCTCDCAAWLPFDLNEQVWATLDTISAGWGRLQMHRELDCSSTQPNHSLSPPLHTIMNREHLRK